MSKKVAVYFGSGNNPHIQTKLYEHQNYRKGSSEAQSNDTEATSTCFELELTCLKVRSFNAFHSYTLNSAETEC